MIEILDENGYMTIGAENGEVALALLEQGFRPSLISLDLMMPVMNGWEFRQRQLADADLRGIPVIVVTSNERPIDPLIASAAGHLRKPVHFDVLLGAIARVLQDYAGARPT